MTAAATQLALPDLVRAVAADRRLWEEHVRFSTSSRYWHRLAALPHADVWLLTWLPEQSTDLHDHGEATAAFTVVHGELEEVRATPDGVLSSHRLVSGQHAVIPAGAVHDVSNRSRGPAVSIHAYAPQLEAMTFWEAEPGGLRRVSTVLTDEPEVA